MGEEARKPEGYLPLTPAVLDIVLALGDEELHGYAIMQEVRRRTGGKRRLAPGTLYRSLRQYVRIPRPLCPRGPTPTGCRQLYSSVLAR